MQIDTTPYERTHGAKPSGDGRWWFTWFADGKRFVHPQRSHCHEGEYDIGLRIATKNAQADGATILHVDE